MKKLTFFLCLSMVILFAVNIYGINQDQNQGIKGTKTVTLTGLNRPNQILIDTAGNRLYVADGPSVYIYSLENFKLLKKFGEKGDGPGQFIVGSSPLAGLSLDLQDDRLMVNSRGKISLFNKTGNFKEEMEILTGNRFIMLGNQYLGAEETFTGAQRIRTLNLYTPSFLKEKELLRSPSWSKDGLEDEELRFLSTPIPSYTVLGNKIFYIGTSGDFKIDVFNKKGEQHVVIEKEYQRIRFLKKHSQAVYEHVKRAFSGSIEYVEVFKTLRIPKFFPALRQVSADRQKQVLYVMTYNKQPGGMSGTGKHVEISQVEFFLFDAGGHLLEKVYLPIAFVTGTRSYIPYWNDAFPLSFADGKLYQLIKKEGEKEYELHITPVPKGIAAKEEKTARFQWVKRAGANWYDHSNALTIDSKENIYITGTFEKATDFDGKQYITKGRKAKDILIAKYDSSGRFLWLKQAGGEGFDEGLSITHDSKNNLIVTGFFQNSATFDNTTLTSAGDRDIFLAKYDNNGHLLWVKQAGGKAVDKGYSVTCDPADNIILTGIFRETASFDGQKRTAHGYSDVFIAKYDPQGQQLWLRQGGGKGFDRGFAVDTDPKGNIYATGYFKDSASFTSVEQETPKQLTSYGGRDIFLVKYTPQGKLDWAINAGGSYWDYGYALACDNTGHVYLTGFFYENANFEGNKLESVNQNDIFLAKYNQKGKLIWVRQAGGTSYARGKGVVTDNKGNVYVTGHFKHNMTFPEKKLTLTAHGDYDLFLAKYTDQGEFLWARHAGGKYYDEACGIALGKQGAIYITGEYNFFGAFGTKETGGNYNDIFLSKILEK